MKKKHAYIILLFSITTLSCKENHHYINKLQKEQHDTSSLSIFANETNINKLVKFLENSDCYYGSVGINGGENSVYESYKRLLTLVGDSVWVELSKNKNAVVRVYAFKALLSKNSPEVKRIQNTLKSDSTSFCLKANDFSLDMTVGFYVMNAKE